MLTPSLAAGILFMNQIATPIDRFKNYIARADFLSVEFTSSTNGSLPVKGKYWWHKPSKRQKLTLEVSGQRREFIQEPEMVMTVNHNGKTYQEYGRIPILVNPPPDDPIILLSFPGVLLIPSMSSSPDAKWTAGETTMVDGHRIDDVTMTIEDRTGNFVLKFFMDEAGRVVRCITDRPTPTGKEIIDQKFFNYDTGDNGQRKITASLPVGYMPETIPLAVEVLTPGDKTELGTWNDARTGKPFDVAKWSQGKRCVFVLTASDCGPSQQMEAALQELRPLLVKQNAELVEIVLGKEKGDLTAKDKGRRIFWDESGAIERAFGVRTTPYFFVTNDKGIVLGGWSGYSINERKDMIRSILDNYLTTTGD